MFSSHSFISFFFFLLFFLFLIFLSVYSTGLFCFVFVSFFFHSALCSSFFSLSFSFGLVCLVLYLRLHEEEGVERGEGRGDKPKLQH